MTDHSHHMVDIGGARVDVPESVVERKARHRLQGAAVELIAALQRFLVLIADQDDETRSPLPDAAWRGTGGGRDDGAPPC